MKKNRRPAVPIIRQGNDPILSEICQPVEEGEDVYEVTSMLYRALQEHKMGVGLAAPQIGSTQRIILVLMGGKSLFMVNPEIKYTSKETVNMTEACLSYPGIQKQVERPYFIDVAYRRPTGQEEVWKFEGLTARIIQHEIDHLDGVCQVGQNKDN